MDNRDNEVRKPSVSFEIGRFYSSEDSTSLTLSMWKGKTVFNFFRKDGDTKTELKAILNNEMLTLLNGVLEGILRDRVSRFKDGKGYQETAIPFDNAFIDFETKDMKKLGTFTIGASKSFGNIRPFITYESSGTILKVSFDSKLISKIIEAKYLARNIDAADMSFMQFCKCINDINSATVIYSGFQKLSELITSGWNNNGGKSQQNNGGTRTQNSSSYYRKDNTEASEDGNSSRVVIAQSEDSSDDIPL